MSVENNQSGDTYSEHEKEESANPVPQDSDLHNDLDVADENQEAAQPASKPDPAVEKQLASEEIAAQKDRILRLHAEMENLRNRTTRDIADQRKYGSISLLRDILPVIDNIDRAIESAQPASPQANEEPLSQENSGYLEGFQLVRQQLLSILKDHHCKPIDALGKPFDPLLHEAILQQPSEDQPKDYVMMVTQGGYRLHDRVVQPSKVIVSSGPAESA